MPHVSFRVSLSRLPLVAILAVGLGLTSGERGEAMAHVTGATPWTLVEEAPHEATGSAAAFTDSVASRKSAEIFTPGAWSPDVRGSIDSKVFALALGAAQCATVKGAVSGPSTLTVIDYSKASTEPRLWVLDLESRALLYEELVAHGQGSGGNFATRFSNTPDSHQTSIGLYVTDTTYVGRNGYSLRLDGLDKGFNDRARERAIVMHGAPYVTPHISKDLGRLGRSHGCPAVREPIARELIDRVKGGNLVFAYYPDPEWLEGSEFLSGCDS